MSGAAVFVAATDAPVEVTGMPPVAVSLGWLGGGADIVDHCAVMVDVRPCFAISIDVHEDLAVLAFLLIVLVLTAPRMAYQSY